MDRCAFPGYYPFPSPTHTPYDAFTGLCYGNSHPYMYFMPHPYLNGLPVPSTAPQIYQPPRSLLPPYSQMAASDHPLPEDSEEKVRRSTPEVRLKPKLLKPLRKLQRKVQIRPERSALTNIGNQLLTYLYIQKKNHRVIRKLFPSITEEELCHYYEFARKLKECMYGYFNQKKLKKLWHSQPANEKDRFNYEIVRKLSFYYLEHLLVLAIMTSKKMPASVKPLHLGIRRKMAMFFRDQTTQCYV